MLLQIPYLEGLFLLSWLSLCVLPPGWNSYRLVMLMMILPSNS